MKKIVIIALFALLLTACTYKPETIMTFDDWQNVKGNVIFEANKSEETKPGGSYPYSYAKVVETTQDYLVVEPLTLDDEAKQEPSWGEMLLQKSKTYIVPRAIMGGYVLKQWNAPVGSIVEVGFNDLAVVEGTKYGQSPVMRIIFYIEVIEQV